MVLSYRRTVTTLRAAAAITTVLGCALALSACAPTASRASSASSGASTAGGSAAPVASPTPTPTPTEPPTPVTLSCDQILTPDQVYAFNPNYGTDPGYAPKKGSLEARIADWKGVSCAWKNQTSGDVVEVAVAHPPASQLEGLKNAAITTADPVPTYGVPPQVEGYFAKGTAGQVQVFRGPYWVVAESTSFFEPGDVAPIMQDVLGNIPAS
ncbi:MAG TPA: iron ABC transporter ATP-binding protein [Leifsonia sp.]